MIHEEHNKVPFCAMGHSYDSTKSIRRPWDLSNWRAVRRQQQHSRRVRGSFLLLVGVRGGAGAVSQHRLERSSSSVPVRLGVEQVVAAAAAAAVAAAALSPSEAWLGCRLKDITLDTNINIFGV